MKEFIIKNKYSVLLGLVVFIAAFLRFYDTPARYGFDPDAIRDATVASYGASTFQFPLTGPLSSLGSFTFGPWYYYQLIIFNILAPLPYSSWIYMGLVSIVVVLLFYQIGKILADRWLGIILAGLAAVSPAIIAPATGLSNPNLITLHAVIAILIFVFILKNKPAWWWGLLLGIDLGLGLNNHYQLVFYLIFPIFLLALGKKGIVYLCASILGAFLTFIPLIYFDFTHSFRLTNGFLFAVSDSQSNKTVYRWLYYVRDFWPTFWAYTLGVPKILGLAIGAAAVITNLFLLIRKRAERTYILLIVAFLIMFVALRFFPGERAVYYLYFLMPLIFIFVGMVFYLPFKLNLKNYKNIAVVTFVLLISYVIASTLPHYHSYDTRIDAFNRVNRILKKFPNEKISVFSCQGVVDYKSQAVMYVLWKMNKLGDNEKKIGMIITECGKDVTIRTKRINKEILNLSRISNEQLIKDGWTLMTPEIVFNHYTRWYEKK